MERGGGEEQEPEYLVPMLEAFLEDQHIDNKIKPRKITQFSTFDDECKELNSLQSRKSFP